MEHLVSRFVLTLEFLLGEWSGLGSLLGLDHPLLGDRGDFCLGLVDVGDFWLFLDGVGVFWMGLDDIGDFCLGLDDLGDFWLGLDTMICCFKSSSLALAVCISLATLRIRAPENIKLAGN